MTLRSLLDKRPSPDQALRLFAQMLDGVEAAHMLGVNHRDLKPENMLYDPSREQLVVADFGIAHFEEELIVTAVETRDSERLANLRYSAPEQRSRGRTVDHRADIFALGLILNELFTGEVPQGSGCIEIETIAPSYAYLDPLVERMIQQNPDQRPQSIAEVKKLLIGHRNTFVALQDLDAKRQMVVPANTPPQPDPITVVDVDWQSGRLFFELNCSRWEMDSVFQKSRRKLDFLNGSWPRKLRIRR